LQLGSGCTETCATHRGRRLSPPPPPGRTRWFYGLLENLLVRLLRARQRDDAGLAAALHRMVNLLETMSQTLARWQAAGDSPTLKQHLSSQTTILQSLLRAEISLQKLSDVTILQQNALAHQYHRNPLNRAGVKCFSQSDEDGITLEILRRVNHLSAGSFAEFGVGNGMENNTLVLLALGWRGYWAGNETLAFPVPENSPALVHLRQWINLGNIIQLAQEGCQRIGVECPDVISIDLDGNDLHLVGSLLAGGFKPLLFIVEYNAKFPPPLLWQISYDESHAWQSDDYFGASLASFEEVFRRHGYRLVCCNANTGANAFFVRVDKMVHFADVPEDIADIYVGPRYYLPSSHGHRPSTRTIEAILKQFNRKIEGQG